MSLTLAQAERTLVRRKGPMLLACGLATESYATDGTPRDYLADPIARALRAIGLKSADPTAPADADVAEVAEADLDAFLDCAELFVIEATAGNFTQVDYTAGQDGRKLGQFRADALALLKWKREQVLADHKAKVNLRGMPGDKA